MSLTVQRSEWQQAKHFTGGQKQVEDSQMHPMLLKVGCRPFACQMALINEIVDSQLQLCEDGRRAERKARRAEYKELLLSDYPKFI